MTNSIKPEGQEHREADLYHAYQYGYSSVREADSAEITAEFSRKFGDDGEALEQFQAGVTDEEAKRMELGMTPAQYHAHYIAKNQAFRERRAKTLRGM